jgi:hypothetical protein
VPRFSLPSGACVDTDSERVLAVEGMFASELDGQRAELTTRDGKPLGLDELPLADFHSLRAILTRLGRIPEDEVSIVCQNCETRFEVKPSSALELGPYADDELDDDELDGRFAFDIAHAIPALDGSDGTSELRLAPRTVAEAAPMHRALERASGLRITSAMVGGMGLVELDGERDARKIARKLQLAPDDVMGAVIDWFELAHYPARLEVPHPCPSCGMTEYVAVPAKRELSSASAGDLARRGGFLTPAELEVIVREEAESLYAELGVSAVDLALIEGPAETDDGGEPLLGCYRHPDPEGLVPRPAEIRIFHRTFENVFQDEGPYDVRAEIRETIQHELEHHLAYLAGQDAVDDDEQSVIHHELAQRVGKREVGRRASREMRSDLWGFVTRTWYVWLIALAATLLSLLAER